MIIKEINAEKYFCPMVNMIDMFRQHRNCVGMQCMAWRFILMNEVKGVGYCGLAGDKNLSYVIEKLSVKGEK